MDDLTDHVDVGMARPAPPGSHPRPQGRRHRVGGVQPPSRRRRGPASASSRSSTSAATAGRSWSSSTRMSWPSNTSASGAVPGRHPPTLRASAAGTSPRSRRVRALLGERPGQGGVVPADVVEHPVEQHPDAALVRGGDQGVEVGVVAQPRVDPEAVDRCRSRGCRRAKTGPSARPLQPQRQRRWSSQRCRCGSRWRSSPHRQRGTAPRRRSRGGGPATRSRPVTQFGPERSVAVAYVAPDLAISGADDMQISAASWPTSSNTWSIPRSR